jgi:hypothetical protein
LGAVVDVSDTTDGPNGTTKKAARSEFKGDTGATGATGDTGATGATGAAGTNGTNGTNGTDGANAYVYIAYASDDSGTGFTTTFDAALDYIAVLSTDTEIASPVASDFTGLWKNYKGATGAQGPQGEQGEAGAGSGDVVGPASSTDNAIARYDSTTGKLIQNSTVTVDDTGNMTFPNATYLKLADGIYSGQLWSSNSTLGVDGFIIRNRDNTKYGGLTIGGLFSSYNTTTQNGGGFMNNALSTYRTLMNRGDVGSIITASSGQFSWNSATGFAFNATADTGLARDSAGVVRVTDGSTGTGNLVVGTIELGHASDTTLSRSSAGVLAVEGVAVPTVSSTSTLTNKTLTAPAINNPTIALSVEPATDDTYVGPSLTGLNAGATVAQWELVILSSSGTWVLADANASATYAGMLGLATSSGTNGNALTVATKGAVIRNDGWAWTAGQTLYMSETAGAITATQPATADAAIRVVGFALSDDCIYLDPSPDYVTHT